MLTVCVFDHYTYITLLCFPVFTSFLSLMTLCLCHCCRFGFLLVTTFPWASFVVLLPLFVPCNYLLCPYCVHQFLIALLFHLSLSEKCPLLMFHLCSPFIARCAFLCFPFLLITLLQSTLDRLPCVLYLDYLSPFELYF